MDGMELILNDLTIRAPTNAKNSKKYHFGLSQCPHDIPLRFSLAFITTDLALMMIMIIQKDDHDQYDISIMFMTTIIDHND